MTIKDIVAAFASGKTISVEKSITIIPAGIYVISANIFRSKASPRLQAFIS